jgi:imidazoleglycerol phosphate synthase glutamine amidotransferase subunit HisH
MIAIIDYGRGNLGSVEKAFERLGLEAVVTQEAGVVDGADAVVLPGDGAFHDAMTNLDELGLMPAVHRALDGRRPRSSARAAGSTCFRAWCGVFRPDARSPTWGGIR